MIKALVAQIKPAQRAEAIPSSVFPSLGRFVGDYHAFRSGNEVKVGFAEVDTAKTFAKELAAKEPASGVRTIDEIAAVLRKAPD